MAEGPAGPATAGFDIKIESCIRKSLGLVAHDTRLFWGFAAGQNHSNGYPACE